MAVDCVRSSYASLVERVLDGYSRSLCGAGPADAAVEGAADLRRFFAEWYATMAQAPEAYGLPIAPDDYLEEGEPSDSEHRQEVSGKFKKLHDTIGYGLELLLLAGAKGVDAGETLILSGPDYTQFMAKHPKIKRRMMAGMALAGLEVTEGDGALRLRSGRHPRMFAALPVLAHGCLQQPNQQLAMFHFSRCDMRAQTPDYSPDPAELYACFGPADRARLLDLHQYMLSLGHKTAFQFNAPHHGWEVQYQGDRKIKSSPILHVEYSSRLKDLLNLRLKCVSSSRIVPLVEQRGQAFQEDFFRRTFKCRSDEGCSWCSTRKGMGPAVLNYQGGEHVICWYTRPDTPLGDDTALGLVKEYVAMHQQLGQG